LIHTEACVECTECGNWYRWDKLNQHKRAEHQTIKETSKGISQDHQKVSRPARRRSERTTWKRKKQVHRSNEAKLMCPKCQSNFKVQWKLDQHIRNRKSPHKFFLGARHTDMLDSEICRQCTICDAMCTDITTFRTHYESLHPGEDIPSRTGKASASQQKNMSNMNLTLQDGENNTIHDATERIRPSSSNDASISHDDDRTKVTLRHDGHEVMQDRDSNTADSSPSGVYTDSMDCVVSVYTDAAGLEPREIDRNGTIGTTCTNHGQELQKTFRGTESVLQKRTDYSNFQPHREHEADRHLPAEDVTMLDEPNFVERPVLERGLEPPALFPNVPPGLAGNAQPPAFVRPQLVPPMWSDQSFPPQHPASVNSLRNFESFGEYQV